MTYAVGYEDCLEKHKHEKKSLWAIITSGGMMQTIMTKEKFEVLYLVFSVFGLSMLFLLAIILE